MNMYGENAIKMNAKQIDAIEAFENSGVNKFYTVLVNVPYTITSDQLENMSWFDARETNGVIFHCKCGHTIICWCDLSDINCKYCGSHYSIENPQLDGSEFVNKYIKANSRQQVIESMVDCIHGFKKSTMVLKLMKCGYEMTEAMGMHVEAVKLYEVKYKQKLGSNENAV